jgi:hypothetical protein
MGSGLGTCRWDAGDACRPLNGKRRPLGIPGSPTGHAPLPGPPPSRPRGLVPAAELRVPNGAV